MAAVLRLVHQPPNRSQLIPWQKEVGSPWEHLQPPPTEYTLTVVREAHRRLEERGIYDITDHGYFMSQAWQTVADFRRLVHGCSCRDCTPPNYPASRYVDPGELRSAGSGADLRPAPA